MRALFRQALGWWELWVPVVIVGCVLAAITFIAFQYAHNKIADELVPTVRQQIGAVKDQNEILKEQLGIVKDQNRRSVDDRIELHRENEQSRSDRSDLREQQRRIMKALDRIDGAPK